MQRTGWLYDHLFIFHVIMSPLYIIVYILSYILCFPIYVNVMYSNIYICYYWKFVEKICKLIAHGLVFVFVFEYGY